MIVQVVLKDRELTVFDVTSALFKANGDTVDATFYRLEDVVTESYPLVGLKSIYYNDVKGVVIDMVSNERVYRGEKIKSGSLSFQRGRGDEMSCLHSSTVSFIAVPLYFVRIN